MLFAAHYLQVKNGDRKISGNIDLLYSYPLGGIALLAGKVSLIAKKRSKIHKKFGKL